MYLENRSFNVRHNLQNYNQFPISAGVPQSSDITLFLYSIYMPLIILKVGIALYLVIFLFVIVHQFFGYK
jgi:hypothetical protein